MFGRMLAGPTIARAPENDEGADADLDLDDDISLDEPDDEPDDSDVDDQDDVDFDPADLEDVDEPPPAKASRADNRVAVATRIAKEAKERADRLEREMADLRANQRPAQPQETGEQRNARLAAMEPWERTEALRQEDSAEMRRQLARIEFESKDSADKAAYESLCARAPVAAKLKDEVEARLSDMRRNGTTAPRETVLRWVIGDRALANANKATGKARAAAASGRNRQTATPPGGKGNAAPENGRRSNTTSARDKRLEAYQL